MLSLTYKETANVNEFSKMLRRIEIYIYKIMRVYIFDYTHNAAVKPTISNLFDF